LCCSILCMNFCTDTLRVWSWICIRVYEFKSSNSCVQCVCMIISDSGDSEDDEDDREPLQTCTCVIQWWCWPMDPQVWWIQA
jgi:hypothetical protein